MDLFHRRPLLGHSRPTTHRELPQLVRETGLWLLPIRSGRKLSLADPRVNDGSVADEIVERYFFRDAFEHQHRERVCVRMRRWGDVVVFDEFWS